ncbi:MAG: encapsulin-associated ferritin-like protein [Kosmotogaceae bacterium]
MIMYHEDLNELSEKAKDITRALNSLKEEVEAVDWYNQRADVTKDESIKAILEHNRDEEIEHAAMIIEWLRRNMQAWDDELKTYLFTERNSDRLLFWRSLLIFTFFSFSK